VEKSPASVRIERERSFRLRRALGTGGRQKYGGKMQHVLRGKTAVNISFTLPRPALRDPLLSSDFVRSLFSECLEPLFNMNQILA
jgi:hypothetical protein